MMVGLVSKIGNGKEEKEKNFPEETKVIKEERAIKKCKERGRQALWKGSIGFFVFLPAF